MPTGAVGVEGELDGADGAVALFRDDDFGDANQLVQPVAPFLPFLVRFRIARVCRRLGAGEVIFLAEHEHHDVGILFDRAGFAQV